MSALGIALLPCKDKIKLSGNDQESSIACGGLDTGRSLTLAWDENARNLLSQLEMPNLLHLRIELDGEHPRLTTLFRLFAEGSLSTIRHLSITGGGMDAATMAKLGKLPQLANLLSLDLSDLGLDDAAIAAFVKEAPLLPQTTLELSNNELSSSGIKLATGLGQIQSRRQNRAGTAARLRIRKFAGTRYRVAEGLAEARKWKLLAVDGETHWGQYRGNELYQLHVSRDLKRFGCSCPSSDQPCKHVVALALIALDEELPSKPWRA